MRPSLPLVVDDLVVEHRDRGAATARPIDGLTFDARPGSLVALVGPPGCGKTTLLACLAGLHRPAGGSVRLGARDVALLGGTALDTYRRRDVGIAFRSVGLVSSLSVIENVMVPLRALGHPRSIARGRAYGALCRAQLGLRARLRPGRLTVGEQRRVALARAFATDPQLLLADEPTAHLDPASVGMVLGLLRSLADDGRVTIVATHDERVVRVADRVIDLAGAHRGTLAGAR